MGGWEIWNYLIEQILLTLVLTEAIIWEEIREAECAYYDELEGASCLDGFHAIDIMVKVFVTHSIKSSNHPMGTLIGIMNNSDLRKYDISVVSPCPRYELPGRSTVLQGCALMAAWRS